MDTDHGDETALHEAIVEALPAVRRFARGLTGNLSDADDLLQSTVERTLGRARPDGLNINKWMFRICRNLWIDELRARGVRQNPATLTELAGDQTSGGSEQLLEQLTFAEVMRAMDALSQDQRTVLVLVAIEGISYRDAAEVLEIPSGTVMSRLARARANLAAQFEGKRQTVDDDSQETLHERT